VLFRSYCQLTRLCPEIISAVYSCYVGIPDRWCRLFLGWRTKPLICQAMLLHERVEEITLLCDHSIPFLWHWIVWIATCRGRCCSPTRFFNVNMHCSRTPKLVAILNRHFRLWLVLRLRFLLNIIRSCLNPWAHTFHIWRIRKLPALLSLHHRLEQWVFVILDPLRFDRVLR